MTTLDPAQVLEDAADILLVNGRCRTVGRSSAGEFCVLGALAEAIEPGWWNEAPCSYWTIVSYWSEAAVAALARRLPPDPMSEGADDACVVYVWNDSTFDDDVVRDTLLLAAKDLRGAA